MSELVPSPEAELDSLHTRIRAVIDGARQTVVRSVNVAMVHAYWEIGQIIDEHVTVASRSESYGSQLFSHLAKRLQADYGPGFERSNLRYMRQFYEAFDIRDAPPHESLAKIVHAPRGQSSQRLQVNVELSWTHYRLLTKVHQIEARRYYLNEAVAMAQRNLPPGPGQTVRHRFLALTGCCVAPRLPPRHGWCRPNSATLTCQVPMAAFMASGLARFSVLVRISRRISAFRLVAPLQHTILSNS